MPKMIVSIDGVVIKEVQLTKDRTTLGRRPYNDIVIDNLAISGEHAVLEMQGDKVYLEDLDSTNGTYVNGKAARKQLLQHGDVIDVGKYKIKFDDRSTDSPVTASPAQKGQADVGDAQTASIKVLSGAASGREVRLSKVVTTVGKPGVAVAAITRRHGGFFVHHVEGSGNPTLNGDAFGTDPTSLSNGDVIELAGTKMQFVQA
ncbi:FHA domain-containing protein [Rhodoferax sp. PAMC 29310]|uniref:FHA domain-containing protein n=1 Tax=Rhodoferax sp. PAMC 29310 TaxID=2822760 RepID=UPI001B31EEB3|nr:FHA domain-containing protein [Rhodoferax sp. PAMC 29310]